MQKLLPYWSRSPQPGSTCDLQKLSYDLLGIVDHRDNSATVYIFDERVEHKTADHTFSYLLHYLKSTGKVPSWISRVHMFLDNAGSTNKNQYLMSACLEVVQQQVLQYLQVSSMIPGHTKFPPDILFAKIAKDFYTADVFNKADLQQIAEQFALVILDNGGIVRTWTEKVGEKYSSSPGIREMHDFVTIAMPSDKVVMKVREKCYAGPLRDTPTEVKCGFTADQSCIPRVADMYKAKSIVKQIPESKLGPLNSNV